MWDAKMAFEWVRDNIAAFGGNPVRYLTDRELKFE